MGSPYGATAPPSSSPGEHGANIKSIVFMYCVLVVVVLTPVCLQADNPR